jgi:TNF receptor-associated factor 3
MPWPFRQKVTLSLLDQVQNRRHISDTFKPDPTSSSFQKPTSPMNVASGCPMFVLQSIVESPSEPYLRNETLFIRVTVDISDLSAY